MIKDWVYDFKPSTILDDAKKELTATAEPDSLKRAAKRLKPAKSYQKNWVTIDHAAHKLWFLQSTQWPSSGTYSWPGFNQHTALGQHTWHAARLSYLHSLGIALDKHACSFATVLCLHTNTASNHGVISSPHYHSISAGTLHAAVLYVWHACSW